MWGVHCLKQDLQDLSDLQDWTSLLPKTPVIELPNYLLKLHKVCGTKEGLSYEGLPTEALVAIVTVALLYHPPQ